MYDNIFYKNYYINLSFEKLNNIVTILKGLIKKKNYMSSWIELDRLLKVSSRTHFTKNIRLEVYKDLRQSR